MTTVTVATAEEALAEIEAEKERRRRGEALADEAHRLEGSLREFMRAAWPVIEPATPFRSNWHIDAISDHLEAAYRRQILRLVINIPPRTMKSTAVTVAAPAWRWTVAPHERFLTASYGSDLATRDAVKTRRLIASSWFLARWIDRFRLTSDQNTKTRYENDRTGYRIATSVGGTATGEGGDVIVIDDPHKADEVESDVQREAVIDWHDGTISTRFNDPDTGVEILVMQRLHERDLTGHVLDLGGWHHLCLPMEYEPSHPFVCPAGFELADGTVLRGDPRTEPGELLWDGSQPHTEARFTADAVDRLKRDLGSYRAAGQLQQRPAPLEGGILKRAWWRYYPPASQPDGSEDWAHMPRFQILLQAWDTALKEKTTSDFTVGALWAIAGANRYLLRVARGQWDLPETKTQLRLLTQWGRERWPLLGMTIYVGNAANGPEVVAQLRDEIPGIISVPEGAGGDKVQRAHAVAPQLEAGNVFIPGFPLPDSTGYDAARTPAWVQAFIEEHSSFPNAAYDDQVDTTTLALIRAGVPHHDARGTVADDEELRAEARRELSAGVMTATF